MGELFGTDGIRGKVGDDFFIPEKVLSFGKALGEWLSRKKTDARVLLGRDTRESGEVFEELLAQGLQSAGPSPIKLGIIPTPGLAYLTKANGADLGVMVSASHNLWTDNGIKVFSADGFKLTDEEEVQVEETFFKNDLQEASEAQSAKNHDDSNLVQNRAREEYLAFLRSTVPSLDLTGKRIALDCANGATSYLAGELLSSLSAEVKLINNEPDGRNINSNCGSQHTGSLASVVIEERADLGLAFDGDGDRVVMVDEKGELRDGDYIMAILGREMIKEKKLPEKTLVATQMSNIGLELSLRELGGRIIRTEVGDKFVLEELLRGNLRFGGEQSGHIIFLDHLTTGDGLITSLQILKVLAQYTHRTLSELCRCLQKFPQVLKNVAVREKLPLTELPSVREAISSYKCKLKDRGRIFVRYSGTEPVVRIMLEGPDQGEIEAMANSLAELFQEAIGI